MVEPTRKQAVYSPAEQPDQPAAILQENLPEAPCGGKLLRENQTFPEGCNQIRQALQNLLRIRLSRCHRQLLPMILQTHPSVTTGNKGGTSTTGNTFGVDYQLTSNLSADPPGTYTITLTYTLTGS